VRNKATHGGAAVPHAEIDALQLRVECAVVQTYQGHLRTFISWNDLSPKIAGTLLAVWAIDIASTNATVSRSSISVLGIGSARNGSVP
jgi:hypothetical protein